MTDDRDHDLIRLAVAADIETIVALTNEAYAVYESVLDEPPIPVTEDYARMSQRAMSGCSMLGGRRPD